MAPPSGTDDMLLVEQQRIRRKRQQNAERRDRFLNARKRIMGVDVDALDAQVEQKRQENQDAKDENILDRLRILEIERVLEESKEEERQMREYQKAITKESWDNAVAEKSRLAAMPEPFLDPLKSGVSAAQTFAGSDPNRNVRLNAQKQQMRRWIQEQLAEKADAKAHKDDDDLAYSEMLKAVEVIRDSADKEEKEMKIYLNSSVTSSNAALIASKMQRHKNDTADWDNLTAAEQAAASSIDLKETTDIAMDENGRILRRDAFRGYTAAQVRHIIQENEDLLQHKRNSDANDSNNDDIWLKQQQMQQQAMEQAHHLEHEMRQSETMLNLEVLKKQIELQKSRRSQNNKDRFGNITPGFFDQFGTDCR